MVPNASDVQCRSEPDDLKNVLKKNKSGSYSRTFSRRGQPPKEMFRQDSFSKKRSEGSDPTHHDEPKGSSSFRLDENDEVVEWKDDDLQKNALEEIQNR